MMFVMRDVGPLISDLDIKRLEKQLNVALPSSYKQFLIANNGGRPSPKFFPISGYQNNPFGQILDFYGINDPYESCRLDFNYQVFIGRMPKGFFPIACEDGGNIICLSLSADNYGAVYYWVHDAETNPPTYKNAYKIANSFQDFLDSIQFVDIADL